jgi:integrase
MAITIKSVQAIGPGETLWDNAVRGFGVRRQLRDPTYVLKYRHQGRQRFVTIGPHGSPWTPETARREARRLLGLVAAGRDPRTERAKDKTSVRAVAEEYLAYAKRRQKTRSFLETQRHLLTNWSALREASALTLTRREVVGHLAAIEAAKGAVTAARARAALSAMFNWAIREGYEIPANPVAGTNRPSEPPSRSRVLADGELAKLWSALGEDQFSEIVRLLVLTAQRREEIGGLRWEEVDFARGVIVLGPERTKNRRTHELPLSGSALAILAAQPRRGPFVFGNGRRYANWSDPKSALDARAGLTGWRLHDLRRTAATRMAELGTLPHVIEAVLNHVSGHRAGVAGIYNRATYTKEMREALERWGNHVEEITK